jgi:hypothetical protein
LCRTSGDVSVETNRKMGEGILLAIEQHLCILYIDVNINTHKPKSLSACIVTRLESLYLIILALCLPRRRRPELPQPPAGRRINSPTCSHQIQGAETRRTIGLAYHYPRRGSFPSCVGREQAGKRPAALAFPRPTDVRTHVQTTR